MKNSIIATVMATGVCITPVSSNNNSVKDVFYKKNNTEYVVPSGKDTFCYQTKNAEFNTIVEFTIFTK